MKKFFILILIFIIGIYTFSQTMLKSETIKSENNFSLSDDIKSMKFDSKTIGELNVIQFESKKEKEAKISREKKYLMGKDNFTSETIPEGVIFNADYQTPLDHNISYYGFYKNKLVIMYGDIKNMEEIKKVFYEEMKNIGYVPKNIKKTELTQKEVTRKEKGANEYDKMKARAEDTSRRPIMSAWDGVAVSIRDYMDKKAANPKSIEYLNVYKLEELSNGFFAQRIEFKIEDRDGGMSINDLIFIMSGDGKESYVTKIVTKEEYQEIRKKEKISTIKFYDAI